ncbi:hypothetical protein HY485_03125, partial [Candidatus Woesearchaeota archaeon]|nr:hypothetical protein [Candidatus Woesearchaeota archaeon]
TQIHNTLAFIISSAIEEIKRTINNINTTVNIINQTVNTINTTVNNIQSTVNTINSTVTNINTTVNDINSTVTYINSNVNNINSTINRINSTINNINSTVTDINSTVTINNAMITNINTTVTQINSIVTYINTTVTNINTITQNINSSVTLINSTVKNLGAFRISSLAAGSPRYPNEEALVEASFTGQNGSNIAPDTINLTIYDKNDNIWTSVTKGSFTEGVDHIWTYSKSVEASPTTGMYTVHMQAIYQNISDSRTVQFRIATGGPYRVALECPSSSTVGQNLNCNVILTDEGEVPSESTSTVWVDTDGDTIVDATEPQASFSKETVPLTNVTETVAINVPSTHTTGTFVVRVKTTILNSGQPDSTASDSVTLTSTAAPAPTPTPSPSASAGIGRVGKKPVEAAPPKVPSLAETLKKALEKLAEEEKKPQKIPAILPEDQGKLLMISFPDKLEITKSQYAEQQFKFVNLVNQELHNVKLTILGLPDGSYVAVPDNYDTIKPNEVKSFIAIFKGNLEEGEYAVKYLMTSDKAIEQVDAKIIVRVAPQQQSKVLSSLTKTLSAEFTPIGITVTIMVLTILALFLKQYGVKEELELLRERFTRIRRKKDIRKEMKQMKNKLSAAKKMFVNEILDTKAYEKTKNRITKQLDELRKELGQKKTKTQSEKKTGLQKIAKILSTLKTKPTKKTKHTTHKHHHEQTPSTPPQKQRPSMAPPFKIIKPATKTAETPTNNTPEQKTKEQTPPQETQQKTEDKPAEKQEQTQKEETENKQTKPEEK